MARGDVEVRNKRKTKRRENKKYQIFWITQKVQRQASKKERQSGYFWNWEVWRCWKVQKIIKLRYIKISNIGIF